MYCKNCGSMIHDSDYFCSVCGALAQQGAEKRSDLERREEASQAKDRIFLIFACIAAAAYLIRIIIYISNSSFAHMDSAGIVNVTARAFTVILLVTASFIGDREKRIAVLIASILHTVPIMVSLAGHNTAVSAFIRYLPYFAIIAAGIGAATKNRTVAIVGATATLVPSVTDALTAIIGNDLDIALLSICVMLTAASVAACAIRCCKE
ncbi:MAG: zinc ribbon domain-containing protein [Clostridia bacterium]|nr:zinc ribbon domain-containing protein [Clostridia bacterium]